MAVFAQDSIIITGRLVGNTKYAYVVVQQFGIGVHPVYKATIQKDSFRIVAPANLQHGVYRLLFSINENRYVDVVINGEPRIDFSLDVNSEKQPWPVFSMSAENKDWYGYRQQLAAYQLKDALLTDFIHQYPDKGDAAVMQVKNSLDRERKQIAQTREMYVARHGKTISGAMVANQPIWFSDAASEPRLDAYYQHQQYWKGINTRDTNMLNTPLYQDHILGYLQYYMNPDMKYTEDEMNTGFRECVDSVIKYFGSNEVMRKFAVDYLWLGFKEIANEKLIQYIDETYRSSATCQSEQERTELDKRLAAYKAMMPGQEAPKIYYTNAAGVEQEFFWNHKDADITIVVFWASWCPHCREAMPKVDSIAAAHRNYAVLAIGLDDDASAYAVAKNELRNVTHYCDYQKWNSRPAQDYHIVATPTFILVDKANKIIDKYSSFEAMKNALSAMDKTVKN